VIDPVLHIALFLFVALVIVTVHACYFTVDERVALASVPLRFAKFVFWCAVVAGVMLAFEHTLASVS